MNYAYTKSSDSNYVEIGKTELAYLYFFLIVTNNPEVAKRIQIIDLLESGYTHSIVLILNKPKRTKVRFTQAGNQSTELKELKFCIVLY